MRPTSANQQSGFTLLEVIISLGLILLLSTALTTMLRSNLDIRESLADRSESVHRLSTAMLKIAEDIQHAFLVPDDKQERYGDSDKRKMKTIFKLDLMTGGDELRMTTMNNKPTMANSGESDVTYVVYRLVEAKDSSGRKHLYRGAAKRLPEDFKEDPPMQLLARGIKTLKVRAWRGDEWSKDNWDSSKREWKNKLPHMVMIEVGGWESEPNPGQDKSSFEIDKVSVLTYKTVVHLPNAMGFTELKERATTVRWDRFAEVVN